MDSLIVDTDGTVTVGQHSGSAPPPAARGGRQNFPGDPKMLRKETWRLIGGRRVRGEVNFAVPGGLGSGLAAALLTPMRNGSRLTFTVTVEVRVPMCGQDQSYLGGQLAEQIRQFSASPQRGSPSTWC